MLALALSSAACASMPENSANMALGAQAAAPRGFVEFCARDPSECGASQADLQVMETASAAAAPRQVAAITYDWSGVFGHANADQTVAATATTTPPQGAVLKASWTAPAVANPRAQRQSRPALKEIWPLLISVNDRINRAMIERTDQETYGVSEYWTMPLESGLRVGDCEDYALEKRHALIAAGVPAEALSIAVVTTVRGDTHAVLLAATDHGEYVLDNLSAWIVPWTKAGYTWRERQVAGSPALWFYAAGGEPVPAAPELAGARLVLASAR
jgi:predicted transglutaminase-like cysteine proteinase